MTVLSNFRVRTKLALLIAMATVALTLLVGIAGTLLEQRMVADRVDKLRATVDSAISIAAALQSEVEAGRLTHDQAIDRLRGTLHALRFDGGEGYVTMQTVRDGITLIHGSEPKREGSPSQAKNAEGRRAIDLIQELLTDAPGGTISFMFAKPGQATPVPKLAYVARFAPWDVVFLAGAYIDDLDAASARVLWHLGSIAATILGPTLLLAWLINHDITGALERLKRVMAKLSEGELDTLVPGAARADEIGAMARAVEVFKDGMIRVDRLEGEQRSGRLRRERRQGMIERSTEDFGASITGVTRTLGAASDTMRDAAQAMSEAASAVRAEARTTSQTAARSSQDLTTVAAAVEELTCSVSEIGGQAASAADVARRAVERTDASRGTMQDLSGAIDRIGNVLHLISDIAAQTNLLALNATIEAARAGEAGKGFSVVAGEVKALAAQTARATAEIGGQIETVRAAATDAVTAMTDIGAFIGTMDEVSGAIAGAVGRQGAATREIAGNVQAVAAATAASAQAMEQVVTLARHAGEASQAVLQAVDDLGRGTGTLQSEVDRFVDTVRQDGEPETTVSERLQRELV